MEHASKKKPASGCKKAMRKTPKEDEEDGGESLETEEFDARSKRTRHDTKWFTEEVWRQTRGQGCQAKEGCKQQQEPDKG